MTRRALAATLLLSLAVAIPPAGVGAQEGPTVVDPNLRVTTLASGIALPTSIAFLGPDDLLVLEKDTGRVLRIHEGAMTTVLDLSVNNSSERGLLGIALHPDFPADPGVYLFWTCRAVAAPDADPFHPEEERCSDDSISGLPDTSDVLQVPLLGNRVDRFTWDGSGLAYDHNLEALRAFQNDGGPVPPGQGDDATGPHGAYWTTMGTSAVE